MWVQCLGQEDPLEEKMATLSIILAWKIPWTEEPGGLQSTGSQRAQGTELPNQPQQECVGPVTKAFCSSAVPKSSSSPCESLAVPCA